MEEIANKFCDFRREFGEVKCVAERRKVIVFVNRRESDWNIIFF